MFQLIEHSLQGQSPEWTQVQGIRQHLTYRQQPVLPVQPGQPEVVGALDGCYYAGSCRHSSTRADVLTQSVRVALREGWFSDPQLCY